MAAHAQFAIDADCSARRCNDTKLTCPPGMNFLHLHFLFDGPCSHQASDVVTVAMDSHHAITPNSFVLKAPCATSNAAVRTPAASHSSRLCLDQVFLLRCLGMCRCHFQRFLQSHNEHLLHRARRLPVWSPLRTVHFALSSRALSTTHFLGRPDAAGTFMNRSAPATAWSFTWHCADDVPPGCGDTHCILSTTCSYGTPTTVTSVALGSDFGVF